MLPLSNLLDRFKNLTNSEKVKKQLIEEILIRNKIPVNLKEISIVKNIIYIKTKPIIKTEILLKKHEILAEINKIQTFKNITNIQ